MATGFDPWDESSKALADMIEKESVHMGRQHQQLHPLTLAHHHTQTPHVGINHYAENGGSGVGRSLPPGFTANHIGAFQASQSEYCAARVWRGNVDSVTFIHQRA